MLRLFRKPAFSRAAIEQIVERMKDMKELHGSEVGELQTEWCFYVETTEVLTHDEVKKLSWLLSETFEPPNFGEQTFLGEMPMVLEVGPRLNFETAWSSTAVSICHACGIQKVKRLERSMRFGLSKQLSPAEQTAFLEPLHDRMTQEQYREPLQSFEVRHEIEPVRIIPLLGKGIDALRRFNTELGLGMDERDLEVFDGLLVRDLKRDPTNVEFFKFGQLNSEHSRHPYWHGIQFIDGQRMLYSLMDIVKMPLQRNPANSLGAFDDDSSSVLGFAIQTLVPLRPGSISPLVLVKRTYHPVLTAETHNHPSGFAPYPGAETGKGGEERDVFVNRLGSIITTGGAGYCTGNMHVPGYELPWEKDNWHHPAFLASPLEILIQASNGASDYGNCFGDPVIYGFARTFGMMLPDGYRSWFKPVMFAIGAGQMDDVHNQKNRPKKGMLLVQIGGPAYRIGIGGGSGSSMGSGENIAELDFNSVQRGDPQMQQRGFRVIRACVEMGEENPIISISDIGAGGIANNFSELVNPAGARINLRALPIGDKTLSVLEMVGNESQERNSLLIWPERYDSLKAITDREGVPCAMVGQITGDGWIIFHDENDGSTPVNLPLDKILGKLPRKQFHHERMTTKRLPLELPEDLTVQMALDRVLRLVSVGSKRFLTTKVDRSVTGLIAQQQCVGPHHTTLCDYAVWAQSHFGKTGVALSLGEQPIKGLLSPEAMARMAVAEALLNIVGAKITALEHIKCQANWMVAAKEPGEGAWTYDAALALSNIMIELGIAIDGGKDSLSMYAKTTSPDGTPYKVKAPGQLVVAPQATMQDITCKVTPDLKDPGNTLLFIDLSNGKNRLGGSALAQVYQQLGDDCPDVEDIPLLKWTFEAVQELIQRREICAVHDRSDGGLIVTLLEMAIAGNVGIDVTIQSNDDVLPTFFSEELGLVIETECPDIVLRFLIERQIPVVRIGTVGSHGGTIVVHHNGQKVLDEPMVKLRALWEATSTALDKLQANPACVDEEAQVIATRTTLPPYHLTFFPNTTPGELLEKNDKPKVAIIREQGSNGDREMASAFFQAGFDVWDVTMTDLLSGRIMLDDFRGVAFVGGFAFADVLDAGKGWAGVIRFSDRLAEQFQRFYERTDTFSLGVCNGCQLMALLGWIPWTNIPMEKQPRFIRNDSYRFESRFPTIRIFESPAIMLKDMAGSMFGIWVSHGEGRLHIPDPSLLDEILEKGLASIRFVNDNGDPVEQYPFNPNGSPAGITALCSPDGRHLALMPHPERTFLTWEWPWMPKSWRILEASPWLRIFQNAYDWCMQEDD